MSPRTASAAEVKASTRNTAALVVIAAAWFGARLGRSYLFDESLTVGAFVQADSILVPLTNQVNLNNHVGLSVLAHGMYRLGIGTLLSYRLMVAVFGLLLVVIVHRTASRLYSEAAGVTAGLFVALHPAIGDFSVQVRGYVPMTLCIVGASVLLIDVLNDDSRSLPTAYYGLVVAAVLLHLYAAVPIFAHALAIAGKQRAGWTHDLRRLVIAGVVGVVGYGGVLGIMISATDERSRLFRLELPVAVGRFLLGQNLVSVAVLSAVALFGLFACLRTSVPARLAAAGCVFSFVIVWAVLAARDSYPRMWVWLVPAVAFAIAAAVNRWPRLLPVALFGIATMAVGSAGAVVGSDNSGEEIGLLLDEAQNSEQKICSVAWSSHALLVYSQPEESYRLTDLKDCDVVVAINSLSSEFESINLPHAYAVGSGRFLLGWTDRANSSVPGLSRISAGGPVSYVKIGPDPT